MSGEENNEECLQNGNLNKEGTIIRFAQIIAWRNLLHTHNNEILTETYLIFKVRL